MLLVLNETCKHVEDKLAISIVLNVNNDIFSNSTLTFNTSTLNAYGTGTAGVSDGAPAPQAPLAGVTECCVFLPLCRARLLPRGLSLKAKRADSFSLGLPSALFSLNHECKGSRRRYVCLELQ